MDYQVLVVEDDQLPADTDWAFARQGDHCYFMVKRCRFSIEGGLCKVLEEVWGISGWARTAGKLPMLPVAV